MQQQQCNNIVKCLASTRPVSVTDIGACVGAIADAATTGTTITAETSGNTQVNNSQQVNNTEVTVYNYVDKRYSMRTEQRTKMVAFVQTPITTC